MKKKQALLIAENAAVTALSRFKASQSTYNNPTFSVLRVNFAPSEDGPSAIDIPYQPFSNRTDVNLPYRLVKVDD